MKKARVLLLNPPTAAVSTEILLGLAYLASSLRKAGHEVKVVDATAPYKPLTPWEVKRIITQFEPHFIGITLTITYILHTYAFLEDLRKMGIPIVAGGSYVTPLPEEILNHGVDIVVIGEGELTICELADYFVGNSKNLEDIDGLCYKKEDGTVSKTPRRTLIKNLDEIPFPAFEDFPIRNYTGSEDPNSNPIFWSILSTRGCPFNCIFCCVDNVFGKSHRFRSAQNVYDEMKSLVDKFGVQKFAFQDDEMLLSRKRLLELCDLIQKNGLKVKMSVRARINSIDCELLLRMKEAGFWRMGFGVESWNDDTLKKIRKMYNVETIKEKLKVLEKTKFPYNSFNTIVGFPWETREHLKKNLEVISEIPKSLRYFSITTPPIPYPGTELYDNYHEEYGFTDWWLDPKKQWLGFPKDGGNPLFFRFSKSMSTLYRPNIFWHYTKEQKKDIERFTWAVFKLYARLHLNLFTFILTYFLLKTSYLLWRKSVRLEEATFKWVPKAFVGYIENKLSYTSK